MFLAFNGSTVSEIAINPIYIASFVEISVLFFALLHLFMRRLPTLPMYNVIIGLSSAFWILFADYPVGVMNPGPAVRYRSGWIIFVLFVFVFVLSRQVFLKWERRT
jgi:hypothetical protein